MASDSLGLALLVGDGDDLDVGAHAGQLAHQILIAPLDVVDPVHLSDALGGQAGDDHGRARTQVTGVDRRAGEAGNPLDDGHLAVYLDVSAHAAELIHIAVAAVPHALGEDAGAGGQAEDSGDLGAEMMRE